MRFSVWRWPVGFFFNDALETSSVWMYNISILENSQFFLLVGSLKYDWYMHVAMTYIVSVLIYGVTWCAPSMHEYGTWTTRQEYLMLCLLRCKCNLSLSRPYTRIYQHQENTSELIVQRTALWFISGNIQGQMRQMRGLHSKFQIKTCDWANLEVSMRTNDALLEIHGPQSIKSAKHLNSLSFGGRAWTLRGMSSLFEILTTRLHIIHYSFKIKSDK